VGFIGIENVGEFIWDWRGSPWYQYFLCAIGFIGIECLPRMLGNLMGTGEDHPSICISDGLRQLQWLMMRILNLVIVITSTVSLCMFYVGHLTS